MPSLVLGAAVVVVAFVLILMSDAGAPPVVRGSAAPAFDLPRVEAGSETAAAPGLALSSLEGDVVLINFWATWCEPCTSEMPAMERLYRSLEGQGFELVAVSIDEKPADAREFAERFGLSFPIVHDADQSVYKAYQTMGVPESLLVDGAGRIVERYVGPREWDAPAYRQRLLDLIGAGSGVPEPPPGV